MARYLAVERVVNRLVLPLVQLGTPGEAPPATAWDAMHMRRHDGDKKAGGCGRSTAAVDEAAQLGLPKLFDLRFGRASARNSLVCLAAADSSAAGLRAELSQHPVREARAVLEGLVDGAAVAEDGVLKPRERSASSGDASMKLQEEVDEVRRRLWERKRAGTQPVKLTNGGGTLFVSCEGYVALAERACHDDEHVELLSKRLEVVEHLVAGNDIGVRHRVGSVIVVHPVAHKLGDAAPGASNDRQSAWA